MQSEGFSAFAQIFFPPSNSYKSSWSLSLSSASARGKWAEIQVFNPEREKKSWNNPYLHPTPHLLSPFSMQPCQCQDASAHAGILSNAWLDPCYLLAGLKQVRILEWADQGWIETSCYSHLNFLNNSIYSIHQALERGYRLSQNPSSFP